MIYTIEFYHINAHTVDNVTRNIEVDVEGMTELEKGQAILDAMTAQYGDYDDYLIIGEA